MEVAFDLPDMHFSLSEHVSSESHKIIHKDSVYTKNQNGIFKPVWDSKSVHHCPSPIFLGILASAAFLLQRGCYSRSSNQIPVSGLNTENGQEPNGQEPNEQNVSYGLFHLLSPENGKNFSAIMTCSVHTSSLTLTCLIWLLTNCSCSNL